VLLTVTPELTTKIDTDKIKQMPPKYQTLIAELKKLFEEKTPAER